MPSRPSRKTKRGPQGSLSSLQLLAHSARAHLQQPIEEIQLILAPRLGLVPHKLHQSCGQDTMHGEPGQGPSSGLCCHHYEGPSHALLSRCMGARQSGSPGLTSETGFRDSVDPRATQSAKRAGSTTAFQPRPHTGRNHLSMSRSGGGGMRHRSHWCASPRRETQEGGWTPRLQAQGPKKLWPLTLEALHSLPICVLVAEADERFLDGSLRPKRLGCRSGAGGAGPGGRSAGLAPPTVPFTLLYCTRLAMAFSASPPVWAGLRGHREGIPTCSALPPPSQAGSGGYRDPWPGGL